MPSKLLSENEASYLFLALILLCSYPLYTSEDGWNAAFSFSSASGIIDGEEPMDTGSSKTFSTAAGT